MNIAIIIIISYLVGSIPVAWIVSKVFLKKDIRAHGTGNVGAMNVYDVSNKKWMFIITFLLDVLKGAISIYIAQTLFGNDPYLIRLSAVMTILGHNYNIFLSLKGGKGLATAVGVLGFINPITIPLWVLMYITSFYVIKKDVQVANVIACLGSFFLLVGIPEEGYNIFNEIETITSTEYKIMYFIMISIIISKHIKALRNSYGDKEE